MSWQPGDCPAAGDPARRAAGRYDAVAAASALALAAFGVVMVGSSSIAIAEGKGSGPFYYLIRHVMFLGMGAVLAHGADAHARWTARAPQPVAAAGVLVLLLLAVFVPGLGRRVNGARRWINLGVFLNFQVVEAVKLMLIV